MMTILPAAADWFPNDHPAMPGIVAHGRTPAIRACSLCHYPNGKGKPENASVIGFPASYFMEQMREFRDGHAGRPTGKRRTRR